MTVAIATKNLEKTFEGRKVFNGLNLEIAKGQITAIVGPNGAGKSTLFNVIAGILAPDNGQIMIEDFNRYKFSYVFQNYRESLLPWRTNIENIAFPLQLQNIPVEERETRARQLLQRHGLDFLEYGYPYELSGGQQQMLAFMRALITKPDLLLLDEPFSALDYGNTLRMRNILQDYYLESGATVFIITHDIEEAVHLAGHIITLSSHPTRILGTIRNSLPYPRTIEILKSEHFHRTTDTVLDIFRSTVVL